MITKREIFEAERRCHQRQQDARHLLVTDETKARPEDMPLVEKVKAAAASGGKPWDDALAGPNVNVLFDKGIFKFRNPAV